MTSHHEPSCCDQAISSTAKTEAAPSARAGVLVLRIDKMDCPTEESLIRKKLEGMKGVDSLDFNLMQRRQTTRHQLADSAAIVSAVAELDLYPVIEIAPLHFAGSLLGILSIDNMDCPTEE